MKKNIEKLLYILINLIVFAGIALFIYFNASRSVEFFCPLMQRTFSTKLIYLTIIHFAAAYIAGIAICAFIKSKTDELCNAYQKRHENISIEKDENVAKIAALEAKIETLEAALESALKNM